MKHYYFGTNMKMYKTSRDTKDFLTELTRLLEPLHSPDLTLFVIPSFPSLEAAGNLLKNTPLLLGAQNMHWAPEGQFSGEVSARMLKELGVTMVMLGHSERRHVFGETDEDLNKKLLSAVDQDLIPLLCVGETREEKEAGISDEVLRMQLKRDLYRFPKEKTDRLRIAYEPVWAIGVSGVPAPAAYVGERHKAMRQCLKEILGEAGKEIPLLFGGSVNPENAPGYLALPDVDGLFVGRSAWEAKKYAGMVSALFHNSPAPRPNRSPFSQPDSPHT